MSQLQAQDVPGADVHFVLVGNESAPNGGVLGHENPALAILLRSQALAGPGLDVHTLAPTPEPLSLIDIVNNFSGDLS